MNSIQLKLNLGADQTCNPNFINVNISSRADVSIGLGREALPFSDSSAELVFSYHTLEHVENYLFALAMSRSNSVPPQCNKIAKPQPSR
jgi:predicted SAM-dependent methyltransferase